jgi:monofunctional biosynthetic peptidoglycan transglycosylase
VLERVRRDSDSRRASGARAARSGRARARRRGLFARIVRALLATILALVLATVLGVLSLRWLNPPTSAFMLEASWHAYELGEHHYRTRYQWVSLGQISPQAAIAVVASEDQQFPYNNGFDFNSIREALRAHEHGARLRGASTITQQVAKNLFLSSERSFVRKGIEAAFTVLIDTLWPKRRILEVYLNVAQFGPGIYGVQAAARQFFHKNAAQLTRNESALLAAVLPNPLRMHPDAPSRYVIEQHDWILRQIDNLGGPAYLHSIGVP